MKAHDIKEVLAWMAVTSVVGIGILGAIVADSAGPKINFVPLSPAVTIDGCNVTTSMQIAQDRSVATVVVTVQNPTRVAKQISVPLQVVGVEFSGNTMSRVPRPDDYKETVVNTTTASFTVGPSKSATRTIMLSMNDKPGDAVKRNQPTYRLKVNEMKPEALEGDLGIRTSRGWPIR